MLDRKKRHRFSVKSLGVALKDLVSNGYGLAAFLLISAALLVASAASSAWPHRAPARLEEAWQVQHGDYVYWLRGRYSIAGLANDFLTTVGNDPGADATTSVVYVPRGMYRVTLEHGYTLERVANGPTPERCEELVALASEAVPASLLSNPVVILADAEHVTRLGLSLVDMPGTAAEPEPTCMNGS